MLKVLQKMMQTQNFIYQEKESIGIEPWTITVIHSWINIEMLAVQ